MLTTWISCKVYLSISANHTDEKETQQNYLCHFSSHAFELGVATNALVVTDPLVTAQFLSCLISLSLANEDYFFTYTQHCALA